MSKNICKNCMFWQSATTGIVHSDLSVLAKCVELSRAYAGDAFSKIYVIPDGEKASLPLFDVYTREDF